MLVRRFQRKSRDFTSSWRSCSASASRRLTTTWMIGSVRILARRLDVAVGDPGRGAAGDAVVAVPRVLVDDQVHRAGFVFERDERDALGRAGPLTQQHQAGHADRRVVRQLDELVARA